MPINNPTSPSNHLLTIPPTALDVNLSASSVNSSHGSDTAHPDAINQPFDSLVNDEIHPTTEQSKSTENEDDWEARELDRLLPVANVTRIMKKTLPETAKLSKEAKELVQECVSEFISFVTSEASERCQTEKRKTITADDIIWSMNELSFVEHADAINMYLIKYREWQEKKSGKKRKRRDTLGSAGPASPDGTSFVTSISSTGGFNTPITTPHHLPLQGPPLLMDMSVHHPALYHPPS